MKTLTSIASGFLFLLFSINASCQLKETPVIFSIENFSGLNSFKTDKFKNTDTSNTAKLFPYQYGYSQNTNIDIKNEGSAISIPEGTIWQFKVESEEALSIGLFFNRYFVPPGSQLLLYNNDRSTLYGAFGEHNNNSDSSLAIADFPGNYVIIEYFEPKNPLFSGQLNIGRVIHVFKDIFKEEKLKSAADTYLPGINCPEGDNLQDVKHAVCLITFSSGSYAYKCSGSLINNTRNDGTPYYLTAAHCLTTNEEAETVVAWFDYEDTYCDGPAKSPKTLSGSNIISTYNSSDFTLLRFSNAPPASYHPYYAGWDATETEKYQGTCIHQSNGTTKKISITNNKISSYPIAIKWPDNNVSDKNSHWEVVWDIGYTEVGSSGSSLFDEHKRIIGQLHGSNEINGHDFFGKLSYSWQHQTDVTQQLKYWLDPDNTGTMICDAYAPPIAPEAIFDVQITNPCLNAPVTLYDQSLFNPTQWLWQFYPEDYVEFHNGTSQNSQNPQVSFSQPGIYDIYLTAGNAQGDDTHILKSIINAKQRISPEISGLETDSILCGCLINNMPVAGKGALSYVFEITENSDRFDISYTTDTMFLTLKNIEENKESFHTQIVLNAFHGECSAKVTKNINVILVKNDNVADAIELVNGSNGTFDNRCASAEENEPFPGDNSCLGSLSWCPETNNPNGPISNSIWYKFEGPRSGFVSIQTIGFDTQLAIYEADSYEGILNNQYKLIAANDDRDNGRYEALLQNAAVSHGKQYWVQLDGSKGGKTGQTELIFFDNNIEIMPNPTIGPLTIKINGPQYNDINVKIHSISGQTVYNDIIHPSDDLINAEINPGLNTGVYIITVVVDAATYTKKIIVLNQ